MFRGEEGVKWGTFGVVWKLVVCVEGGVWWIGREGFCRVLLLWVESKVKFGVGIELVFVRLGEDCLGE